MAKRILVIDDDEDILEILHIIFQDEGYQVILSSTAQASDHIHHIHPDLMVLDIRLAGSDRTGSDICLDFKTSYPDDDIPVILVSAEADISKIASYCGADAFMSKPFDMYRLLKQVEELLS
jgi:two-component system response regulator VicR